VQSKKHFVGRVVGVVDGKTPAQCPGQVAQGGAVMLQCVAIGKAQGFGPSGQKGC